MKNKTIIRCGIDAIRHNVVLAKLEQHYDAHPNSYTPQKQHGILNYLTAAD
jgi:hypothetical protein